MSDEDNSARGQRRGREEADDPVLALMNGNKTPPEAHASPDGPPKKRRRSAKANPEKKFECDQEGCGKSYSRAEHLYRHQLNHTPKNLFYCGFPDCPRYFVRQDLCLRHRERHTTHGSQLHRRDTFAQTTTVQSPLAIAPSTEDPMVTSDNSNQVRSFLSNSCAEQQPDTCNTHQTSPHAGECSTPILQSIDARLSGSAASASTASIESHYQPSTPQAVFSGSDRPTPKRHSSSTTYPLSPEQKQMLASFHPALRQGSFAQLDSQKLQSIPGQPGESVRYGVESATVVSPTRSYSISSISTTAQPQFYPGLSNAGNSTVPITSYAPPHNVSISSMQSQDFPPSNLPGTNASFVAAVSRGLSAIDPASSARYSTADVSGIDVGTTYAYPIFGGDEYNRSPNTMADDFTAWLFNESQSAAIAFSPAPGIMPGFTDGSAIHVQGPYYPQDTTLNSYYSNVAPPQNSMSAPGVLDSTPPQYIMSEEKRQELLDLMLTVFNERPHDAVKRRKDAVFEGDVNADGHILSLRMMHTYIGSYWYHQHAQLPILHKPTFSADKTPNLLLLAVVAIGAATLDKAHGTALTDSAAEFANFVAWHVRWEIIRDADFRPPAKLWVFQTLLLTETYEKMYATRALHERAHIHHDSTLTLMRRGSSLIGRSAFDSPASGRDDKTARSSGSNSASDVGSSEESWARWITNEATRRAAFAAFVIDSTHATMFGHSAKMVAHEMRLPLPCDEALWSATSAAEVARVQSSLQTNGIKPTMFLDGLKKTLNGHRVRTNSFGRTILMAGLLSVSWHMNQRDLQISSLGAQTFGGRDKWRSALLRAFDNWKRDFDEALAEATPKPNEQYLTFRPVDDENIFESRTVLHHLAHMASHVDIVDCQIFAGAGRLLGRSITPKDYSNTREKITERWATRASARDAAFYALKFLAQVLIPPYERDRYGQVPGGIAILPHAFDQNQYMARDDFLLNRPWVLYFAALVVWCYGYALEGPIVPAPSDEQFATPEQRDCDMRDYLDRVGGIRAPDDLENICGKNRCLGLLMILAESFSLTRWELTHEAANLLGNCINKLKGLDGSVGLGRGATPTTRTPTVGRASVGIY